jgi:hypothetical protein
LRVEKQRCFFGDRGLVGLLRSGEEKVDIFTGDPAGLPIGAKGLGDSDVSSDWIRQTGTDRLFFMADLRAVEGGQRLWTPHFDFEGEHVSETHRLRCARSSGLSFLALTLLITVRSHSTFRVSVRPNLRLN